MVIKFPTKVFKSGNSSAVRLSKELMQAAGLKDSEAVDITFNDKDGSLVIKPASQKVKDHDHFFELLERNIKRDKEMLDFLKDK